ncbi:MAG TPA: hypothetical protein VER96_38465 [Polyangiaceae bacterium]|nr:hypothetical protein [Polyangiaceae bacterium]
MHTDRSFRSYRALAFASSLVLGALLLAGCPGTLDNKERFLVDAGNGGKTGSAGNAAGGGEDAAPSDAGSDAAATPDGGPDLGPCGDVVARIFVPSCGGTGCHGPSGAQQDLDLVSPGVAGRVVGVSGIGCTSTLADPANPETSLIYQKLLPTPPCGSPMPLARPALSDEDVACVRAWIAAQ